MIYILAGQDEKASFLKKKSRSLWPGRNKKKLLSSLSIICNANNKTCHNPLPLKLSLTTHCVGKKLHHAHDYLYEYVY